jgi:hypothetical protein
MALIIDKERKKRLERTNNKDCDAALKKLRTFYFMQTAVYSIVAERASAFKPANWEP